MGFIGDALNGVTGAAGGLLGGGGGPLGGILGGGGGGGIGGMLGGLPIVGGMLGGGGQGGGARGGSAIPQGWMNTAGMPMPGAPGYPIQPMQPSGGYNFQGDLSKAGPAESFFAANQSKFGQPTQAAGYWNQNQDKFGGPGRGEQYWNQVSGRFNAPQATTQNAQEAYNTFKATTPADMSPYYDRAVNKADAGVNNAYGARGQFNSSAALQGIADANTNIRAQEAKDNADYGLQRGGLMGNLASAADTSSRGGSQDMLSWLTGGGQMASALDNATLARLMGGANVAQGADAGNLAQLMAGMGAAQGAQGALQNRAQGYFNNLLGLGNAQAGSMAGIYGPMIQGDTGMLDQAIQASLGYPRESLNQSIQGRASSEQGIGNLFGLIGGGKGGGLLGGII